MSWWLVLPSKMYRRNDFQHRPALCLPHQGSRAGGFPEDSVCGLAERNPPRGSQHMADAWSSV